MRLSYQREYEKIPKKVELNYTATKLRQGEEGKEISSKFAKYKKDMPIRKINDSYEGNIMAKSYMKSDTKSKELDSGSLFQKSYMIP